MPTSEPHHSEQGFERLVFFTDAVVAIAITLVVLPLVECPRAARPAGGPLLHRSLSRQVARSPADGSIGR